MKCENQDLWVLVFLCLGADYSSYFVWWAIVAFLHRLFWNQLIQMALFKIRSIIWKTWIRDDYWLRGGSDA
ncbi:hypothetical protein N782_21875 [Pontibacillus yanchengensis Y32]|uniref:Uncharacterized protein n=1 Tax=Pontibacillus yanchengensis Y32 TaxID=1385514 RepID=A0A0A2T9I5_9BACI|nr:hypothetical protein N782_21875 [Pontibacillus yanchengensis Y32]